MNTFFTIYICWPCPWAWTPALSHEFLQFKWRGPWTSDDAFSLLSPSCGCREEDFLIWNTFLLFGHFGPIQGPEPQETWILQFWRRGSWTSYNKMYRCILHCMTFPHPTVKLRRRFFIFNSYLIHIH